VRSSPLARKLAEQAGLDLSRIEGTGPDGRVVKRDVERAMAAAAAAPGPVAPVAPESAPSDVGLPAGRRIPVSKKRQIIARRLAESKFSAPHYYLKCEVRMDALQAGRTRLNANPPESGRVSLNAFLLKFVGLALQRHPSVNASWQNTEIIEFASADIGLAVAVPDGLVTPVVRDCAGKGIVEIDVDLKRLIEAAKNGRLTPEEYAGATFTVTNLGSFGIREFTAIINPPGSAILALGEIVRQPVVNDSGDIVVESRMIMTLSCDHRVVDGAVGAAFLSTLHGMIEDPVVALM
jgi:pyruvate dehydrogenase E2 component (dihydrolipoamide acetyltransferase)